jgi:hypothetical protein
LDLELDEMRLILIPVALIFIPLLLSLAIAYGVRYRSKWKKRKSPFTGNLLRSPGESIRTKIDDLTEDIIFYFAIMPVIPLFAFSSHLSESYFGQWPETTFRIVTSVILGSIPTLFFAVKLATLLTTRRKMRLGYEAELAAGQELNRLMLDGYQVYHDFPAEGFNIDHIVVGRTGVFAIETKGREKPITGNGMSDAEVVYDGDCLKFPRWVEKKPLEQAKSQADWLRKWLSRATGEQVGVQPMVCLPGWFVKRVGPNGIPVLNPKMVPALLRKARGEAITDAQIKRIVYQLDQRCRDVQPKGYHQLPTPR